MKYYLFIDNFRGFKDTFVPITNVNFLVGENSTGKTSILGLIKLFSGPQFLMRPRQAGFGDDHVKFGNFSDMVSRHSTDHSCFHIGSIRQKGADKQHEQQTIGSLYTFVEEMGLPFLSCFTFCQGSQKLSLRFRGDRIRFKLETYPTSPTIENLVAKLMPEWKQEHLDTSSNSFDKLDIGGLPSGIPLLVILGLLGSISDSASSRSDKVKKAELTLPSPDIFGDQVVWVAPIRTKPQRIYDEVTAEFSPDGTHTPFLIRRTLRSNKTAVRFRNSIRKIGKSSGLFEDVLIKNHGRETAAPFEVDIVLDDEPLNLSTVGYGVSQSLPVLVEVLQRSHGSSFAIQQPEVHLHPRAQAALGDMFFEMAAVEHKRFLIETHSDFTIDRFRMGYKAERRYKPESQILFFERRDKHNVVTPLSISESGELPADQPESYREFFVHEGIRLLSVG